MLQKIHPGLHLQFEIVIIQNILYSLPVVIVSYIVFIALKWKDTDCGSNFKCTEPSLFTMNYDVC